MEWYNLSDSQTTNWRSRGGRATPWPVWPSAAGYPSHVRCIAPTRSWGRCLRYTALRTVSLKPNPCGDEIFANVCLHRAAQQPTSARPTKSRWRCASLSARLGRGYARGRSGPISAGASGRTRGAAGREECSSAGRTRWPTRGGGATSSRAGAAGDTARSCGLAPG